MPDLFEAGDSSPALIVELEGPPRGKGRPRVRVVVPKPDPETGEQREPFAHFYVDKETEIYEEALRWRVKEAMRSAEPIQSTPRGLQVVIFAFMPIPQSWSRTKQALAREGQIRPTTKPDWENIAKMTDALNKLGWVDDAHVTSACVFKYYADRPRLRVEVTRL
jgi:Holliday junction resolvase RusA-like endonuclease